MPRRNNGTRAPEWAGTGAGTAIRIPQFPDPGRVRHLDRDGRIVSQVRDWKSSPGPASATAPAPEYIPAYRRSAPLSSACYHGEHAECPRRRGDCACACHPGHGIKEAA
jgi:hypothetical protein